MSDQEAPVGSEAEDDDATSWKEVMAGLRSGQTVEIPVGDDQEFKRRQRQLERRAERQGIQVQITRERGLLRATMTGQAAPAAAEASAGEGQKDRASREERRAQRRAERAAGAGA